MISQYSTSSSTASSATVTLTVSRSMRVMLLPQRPRIKASWSLVGLVSSHLVIAGLLLGTCRVHHSRPSKFAQSVENIEHGGLLSWQTLRSAHGFHGITSRLARSAAL